MIKIYHAADFTEMPWKNKHGSTTQFLIQPPHAQFPTEPFLWRLSSAPVLCEGEFSKFPGFSRALMVIAGAGLTLNQTFLKPFEAHYFSGDESTYAQLNSGPIRDLGFIYDSNQIKSVMQVFRFDARSAHTLECGPAETVLIYAAEGAGKVEDLEINQGEVARIEHAGKIRLHSRMHPCVWVGVRIEKIQT